MGIFDKLKNVFFEVEEVDEEEKDDERERVPVAKKIDTVETKKRETEKEKESSSNTLNFDNSMEKKEEVKERDFKFPMGFDDKDFEVEKTIEIYGPIKEREEEKEIAPEIEEVHEVVSDEPPVDIPVEKEEYHYEEETRYEEVKEPLYVDDSLEKAHKLYEVKDEEINFIAPNDLVFHNGVEQTSWDLLIHVHAPKQTALVQDDVAKYLLETIGDVAIHKAVEFYYYLEANRYEKINEQYPRFITEENLVDVDSEYDEDMEEGEEDDQIFTGDIFKDFNR